MSALDLLFGPIPNAICSMFEYGILPSKNDFLELTPEQYRKYIDTYGDVDGKTYMLVPHNTCKLLDNYNDIFCLTEYEMNGFLKAISIINRYCEGKNFDTDEQKLRYAASKLPNTFTEGTKYAFYHNAKIG